MNSCCNETMTRAFRRHPKKRLSATGQIHDEFYDPSARYVKPPFVILLAIDQQRTNCFSNEYHRQHMPFAASARCSPTGAGCLPANVKQDMQLEALINPYARKQLLAIAEVTSDWIWLTDENNRFIYISPRVYDHVRVKTRGVFIGRTRGGAERRSWAPSDLSGYREACHQSACPSATCSTVGSATATMRNILSS